MGRRIFTLVAALTTLAGLGGAQPALAHHGAGSIGAGGGPIYATSAEVLERGKWSADIRYEYVDLDQFTDAELLAFNAQGIEADSANFAASTFATVAYGLTDKLTVSLQLPYNHISGVREVNDAVFPPEVETEGSPAGLGDLSLFGFYQFWTSRDESLKATAVLGIYMPTGKTDCLTVDGELFEADHQPSSGSWDPSVGLAFTKVRGRTSYTISSTYRFVSQGLQDSELGDVWHYDAAASYRILGYVPPHEHGAGHSHGDEEEDDDDHAGHVHPASYHPTDAEGAEEEAEECPPCFTLDGVLEINGISEGHDLIDGAIDDASGGNVIFLSPGLRLNWRQRWSAYADVGIPIVQDMNPGVHRVQGRYTLGITGEF